MRNPLTEQLLVGKNAYRITFATDKEKQMYRNCWKTVGKGEGQDTILKKGYTEEGLLATLQKKAGFTVEFQYELGNLKV
jgi:hypothetical protein